MKKLWLLAFLFGCTTPVDSIDSIDLIDKSSEHYYIKFAKEIDSLSLIRNVQTFKPLEIKTNLPDQTKVIWESDVWGRLS